MDPEEMGLIDDEEDEAQTLGPCGCTDYHMGDCSLVTSAYREIEPIEQNWWDDNE